MRVGIAEINLARRLYPSLGSPHLHGMTQKQNESVQPFAVAPSGWTILTSKRLKTFAGEQAMVPRGGQYTGAVAVLILLGFLPRFAALVYQPRVLQSIVQTICGNR